MSCYAVLSINLWEERSALLTAELPLHLLTLSTFVRQQWGGYRVPALSLLSLSHLFLSSLLSHLFALSRSHSLTFSLSLSYALSLSLFCSLSCSLSLSLALSLVLSLAVSLSHSLTLSECPPVH